MRPTFALSRETASLVSVFRDMKIGEVVTYAQASKLCGFPVTTGGASQQARKILERDHGIFIHVVRKVGFRRGDGVAMADSGVAIVSKIRKQAKRGHARFELAIKQNLPEREHQMALDGMNRLGIIYHTSQQMKVRTNRKSQEQPDVKRSSDNYSGISRIGSHS